MKEKKSIKKNYILNLIYQVTLIIVPLIVTPYSSRILLPEGIGQYSFCYSIITYFTLLATFGFDIYGQREIAKYQNDKIKQTKVFWEIFICKTITSSISLLILGILQIFNVFGSNSILMLILSINVISIGLDVVFYFQGNEDFQKTVLINVIVKIIGAISIFIFVKTSNDVWIYTLIHSLMLFVSAISLWTIIFKQLEPIKFKELTPFYHLKKSFALFIPAVATTIYCILDKTLIGIITKSNVQNGYYEQSEKIVKLAMTLITCLGFVMIPRNTSEIAKGNHEQVKKNVYTASNFVFLLGLPMVMGIILISDNLIPWFLGDNYEYSITLLKIFSPLILIIGFSNILGQHYLVPYQKDKIYTTSLISGAICNLILNIIFINYWGAIGATISTVIAELIISIIMFIYVRKDLLIKEIFKPLAKPLISSLVMFVLVYPLSLKLSPSLINTLLIILASIFIYILMILILREKFTLTILKNFINKIKSKFTKNSDKNSSK